MSKKVLLALIAAVILIAGCNKSASKSSENALCTVNGVPFTTDEYNEYISQYQGQITPDVKSQIINQWVNNELLYQNAKKEGVENKPEVKRKIELLKKQVVATEYLNDVIKNRAQVTDADVQNFYNSHKDDYGVSIKFSKIMTYSPDNAQAALNELKSGKSFYQVAKKYSVDYNPQQSITLGPYKRGDLAQLPEIEDAAFALKKPGDISGIIQTKYGYFIIKLVSRRKLAKPITYDEAKNVIYNRLSLEKQTNVYMTLLDSLKKNAKISINLNDNINKNGTTGK
ncbi:peptidyl-prolyl cis-trans isomerase [candidate division WOR-3 bacterium]|nr:peptidyl-prolyl cis-trans isomerase [candidate division WOR-3 bacterium]